VTIPENPTLHVQPVETMAPPLLKGQLTAVQLLHRKDGPMTVAVTNPLNPASHAQPTGTLSPKLLMGQPTAKQEDK